MLEGVHSRSARINDEEKGVDMGTDSMVDQDSEAYGWFEIFLIILAVILDFLRFPYIICEAFSYLKSHERGIVLRLGKVTGIRTDPIRKAGLLCRIPLVDDLIKVDLRTLVIKIESQEILTQDCVTMTLDAVLYMHVFDVVSALLRVEKWQESTEILATSMVRKVLGKYELSELLESRQEIDDALLHMLDAATYKWGIKVERVEITDIMLPTELQRAMAAEAQATRSAKSKVLEAQGELEASKILSQAAAELSENPSALQLRMLQTLSTIASEQNSTIVLPFPMELMSFIEEV